MGKARKSSRKKHSWLIGIVVIVVLALLFGGNNRKEKATERSSARNQSETTDVMNTEIPTEKPTKAEDTDIPTTKVTEAATTNNKPTETTKEITNTPVSDNSTVEPDREEITTTIVPETNVPSSENMPTGEGALDKEALKAKLNSEQGLIWFGNVRNDVTGKWRLSEYASSDSQETIAFEYYKAYFEDDEEIHALINISKSRTACISVLSGNMLSITIKKYIQGEEFDAKKLFGGETLEEYIVYLDTGRIEKVE